MKKSETSGSQTASKFISKKIAELADWRGATLGRMRKLIQEADPNVIEKWKWMGTQCSQLKPFLTSKGLRFRT